VATPVQEGLRERKKRRTREAIAAAALELFAQRGFDDVTVEEVAAAAEVSKKTVFNHFPAKEDLVFSRGADHRAALVAELRALPAGTSIVAPFRAHTLAYLEAMAGRPVEDSVVVPRLVMGSRTLRERLFLGWEQEAAVLAPVVAEAAGEPPDAIVPAVVARSLAWAHRVVTRAAFGRLLAGEEPAVVAADLREEAQRAYDLLEEGLQGYAAR
jgi:AcrR family transcriptional regulator